MKLLQVIIFIAYAIAVWGTGLAGMEGSDERGVLCVLLLLAGAVVLVYLRFFRRSGTLKYYSYGAAVAMGLAGLGLGAATSGEAAIGLAESYLKQDKHRDIIGHLPLQSASTSTEAELLGYHALAYLHLDKPEQATNAIGLALDAAPQAVMPQVARVRLLLMAGMVAEAHALAARTASQGRESARAWQALGLSAQIAGSDFRWLTKSILQRFFI